MVGRADRSAQRRVPPRAVALAAFLGVTLQFTVAPVAKAVDLPAQLLAAARSMPVDKDGREVCLAIVGLTNNLRLPYVLGDQSTSAGSDAYSAATRGAYLGDGPADTPAPPFAQALIDAGVAKRLALTWTQHTRVPTMAMPQLQDLGTPRSTASATPQPPFTDRTNSFKGDAYIVTGPDAELFAHDGDLISPVPPAVTGTAGPNATLGSPPPGLWSTSHVCYLVVADRVLEYGDVVSNGNGVSQISALVLFRPGRVPSWVADPRVVENLSPRMKPLDVRLLTFRNDGDGWVVQPFGFLPLPAKTHIVGANE